MMPRERAVKTAQKITQWFWARTMTNATNCDAGEKHAIEQIEQAIIADRQALQSEIVKQIKGAFPEMHGFYSQGLSSALRIIQSVFAQQSKPFSVFKPADSYFIAQAESDRRVLAEREACAKIAEEYEAEKQEQANESSRGVRDLSGMSHAFEAQAGRKIKEMIRARSNQPEEKPNLTPFDPSCSTCVREAKEEAEENAKKNCETSVSILADSMKRLDQSARIATLHEWQAQDQKTIQELNQTCYELSRQLAEQKEENERLTQKPSSILDADGHSCRNCPVCCHAGH